MGKLQGGRSIGLVRQPPAVLCWAWPVGGPDMGKYIIEARSEAGFPSLYSMTPHGMFQVERHQATRFSEEQAREIAKREKALRPHRRILKIAVGED